jgi:hypothetical protein
MMVFVSKTSNTLNRQPYDIENITKNLCLNPLYKSVSTGIPCNILADSGAFQEREIRTTPEISYARQMEFQARVGTNFNYIAAYDRIDHYAETMEANNYLLNINSPSNKILIVQGKNESEYTQCMRELLELSHSADFVLGMGGIARIATSNVTRLKLYSSIDANIRKFDSVKHIHLFGVLRVDVITDIIRMFPHITITSDTAGIEMRSVMGYVFRDGVWRKKYTKEQKRIEYHPCVLAKDNIQRVLTFFDDIEYRIENNYSWKSMNN